MFLLSTLADEKKKDFNNNKQLFSLSKLFMPIQLFSKSYSPIIYVYWFN
jgi:hypothetical protein